MTSTYLSPDLQTRKQVGWAASISLVGTISFALIICILHFLRPDLNPLIHPASRYAVGAYGFLMTSAFFSMSVASFALVVGLYHGVPAAVRSPVGLTLFGLWGIGVLIAMLFPMDVEGAAQTLAGTIHDVSGPLAFLCMSSGVFLISQRFQQDDQWRPFYRTALLLSLLIWAGFIATFLSFVTQPGFLGVYQRFTLAMLVTWMILTAAGLLKRA